MVFITRKELKEMERIVLDEETGMTALDLWEWQHSYDDIEVIEEDQVLFFFWAARDRQPRAEFQIKVDPPNFCVRKKKLKKFKKFS